mgnify:CR=1 FL=1
MTEDAAFIWRAMCRTHWFDEYLHGKLVDGTVKCFVYLSSGQEAIPAAVACAFRDKKVNLFCQHRSHAAYIAFGGDMVKLRDELLGLETGTTRGVGGDPCHAMESEQAKMWGHSGLVADHVPIAVGMAFATREWSVCFFGDSAVEEDVFWPAVGFAVTHHLPVLFVEEDNGLSVVTETAKRRSWQGNSVASGFQCWNMALEDDPFALAEIVSKCTQIRGPRYFRVRTCRKYRHVGPGSDGPMKWDRMQMIRLKFLSDGPQDAFEAARIESEMKREIEDL